MSESQILDTSRKLFMRYGIKSITMDDVARELGISKKTLYQFVRNKSDLIERIIQLHIHEEKECFNAIIEQAQDPIEQVLLMAKHVVETVRKVRPTTMFDLRKYYRQCWDMLDAFHLKYVYGMIRSNLEAGIEAGLYRDDMNPDIVAKLYVGKTMWLTDEEIFPSNEYDLDTVFEEYIQYHLRGIVSEKGKQKLKTYQPD